MKLQIGFSPCPNDTFIFDAMIHQKIDCEGLTFEPFLEDVATLNTWSFDKKLAITKISYHAFAYVSKQYQLLTSGSALGRGCGPLLISKRNIDSNEVDDKTIALPGKYTTAHFLFSIAFPEAQKKSFMLFHEIEPSVSNEQHDLGVIIHENRFTYAEKGLKKVVDLGELWEQKTKMPIPLGGICIDRNLPDELKQKVNRVLRRSIEFAFENRDSVMNYVSEHAQEMNEKVMNQHIDLYVNDFSIDLGNEGKSAVEKMYQIATEKEIISSLTQPLFVEQ